MSIFSLSSLFNRFSKWAEKQPQIKLDKTLTQMERITSWRYEDEQEQFGRKIKGLIKDGAVVGTPELLRALEVELKSHWFTYRKRNQFDVVKVMLQAGAQPDDRCFELAHKARAPFLGDYLQTLETVSLSAMRYAVACHSSETALIEKLLPLAAKKTPVLISDALRSRQMYESPTFDLVKKIVDAGVTPSANNVCDAVVNGYDKAALYLLEAGAPGSAQSLASAVHNNMFEVAKKLHEKGASFDEALVLCDGRGLQARMKHYRKAITGEAYVDEELVAELQKQVAELTERLEKVEGVTVNKPARTAAKAGAAKPK